MPVSKKKGITPENALSTSEVSDPPLPEQQEFHQHLRALAQSAMRTVLELVMREELDAMIGAAWGECSPKRRGYRNGTYTRDLATATGRLEEIKVPRDREGQFHTQAFERDTCYEPHIAEGPTQIDLIVTDGHDGLLAALTELFSATPRQRCLVHKQRNMLAAIPRRERAEVQAEVAGIWGQATKSEALTQLAAFQAKYAVRYPEAVRSLMEDEEHLLTFYAFPAPCTDTFRPRTPLKASGAWCASGLIRSTSCTLETSYLSIVWATIQDIRLHKLSLE
jgi:transposase-like protein